MSIYSRGPPGSLLHVYYSGTKNSLWPSLIHSHTQKQEQGRSANTRKLQRKEKRSQTELFLWMFFIEIQLQRESFFRFPSVYSCETNWYSANFYRNMNHTLFLQETCEKEAYMGFLGIQRWHILLQNVETQSHTPAVPNQ